MSSPKFLPQTFRAPHIPFLISSSPQKEWKEWICGNSQVAYFKPCTVFGVFSDCPDSHISLPHHQSRGEEKQDKTFVKNNFFLLYTKIVDKFGLQNYLT